MLGTARKLVLSEADRRRIAYHEAGHAIVGMLTPGADPVRKVSIIPRGMALGVTLSTPEDDRFNYSEDELRAKIRVSIGGRAAEELEFGEATTGAESDIQQVTRIARGMVERWGMSEKVGFLVVAPRDGVGPLLPGLRAGVGGHAGAGGRRGAADRGRGAGGHPGAAQREPREARRARPGPARARDARRGRRLRGRRHRARPRARRGASRRCAQSRLAGLLPSSERSARAITSSMLMPSSNSARAVGERHGPAVLGLGRRARHGLGHPAEHLLGHRAVGAGQHDHELVAAPAEAAVGHAHGELDRPGRLADAAVALEVADSGR